MLLVFFMCGDFEKQGKRLTGLQFFSRKVLPF